MRTEQVVLSQLQNWAENEDNIRALILVGSRVDPRREPDLLSDYDIEVYVRETEPITRDGSSWISEFGSVMVRWPLWPQPTFSDEWITQLVLFDDGIRIDFQFTTKKPAECQGFDDEYRVLVDKDGRTEHLPTPTYSTHTVRRPTVEAFDCRMAAFWWDIIYVAKGLRRGELNYAKYMLDGTIRFDKLQPLTEWYVGVIHGFFSVDVGIFGRWFHRYLDEETWQLYLQTFAGASIEDNWRALFETIDFVRVIGKHVAETCGFDYPEEVDTKVSRYIKDIKEKEAM